MNYNPFELEPPKIIIENALKQFKVKARKLLEDIAALQQNEMADWLIEDLQRDHKQLVHKISRYQMYINGVDVSADWEAAKIAAKQVLIKDMFHGKLINGGMGRLKGKCPFHKDDSPSFIIYPTNDAHCFGCQWNGDSIAFVMKRDNLEFKQAVQLLSNK